MCKISSIIKLFFDIVLILVFSPLILVFTVLIAIVIRLSSGSGVIFRQERAGRDMKPFTLYKFRTMDREVDPFGPSPKTGADPRLTRVGRFLRATSLDELPQMFNVIKGDMSLVGPRPLYMEQAQQWNERQKRRLEVKPGITGLAQISGRGEIIHEDKIELDVQYVERQNLLLDVRILLATVFKVLRPKDIYEKKYSQDHDTRPS